MLLLLLPPSYSLFSSFSPFFFSSAFSLFFLCFSFLEASGKRLLFSFLFLFLFEFGNRPQPDEPQPAPANPGRKEGAEDLSNKKDGPIVEPPPSVRLYGWRDEIDCGAAAGLEETDIKRS